MIKLILCFVIVMSSSYIGFFYSQRLYSRKSLLQSFSLLLNNAATKIRYTSEPLSVIFSQNFAGYEFSPDKPFSDQWAELLSNYSKTLTDADICVLTEFSILLGATDIDGQLNNIELYTNLLSESISSAEDNIVKKSKLYKMLGVCFGIVVSILLI